MERIPVIATAFGTSTLARDTYAFFEKYFQARYPGAELLWAFTSRVLREKASVGHGEMRSLENVLHEVEQRGFTKALIQSLHILPGFEFQKITEAARCSKLKTAIGMPLLTDDADIEKTVAALGDRIPSPEEWVTVLVGHGTQHPVGVAYHKINTVLRRRFKRNVFISVVEGEPGWNTVVASIHASGLKKVKFIPLMFVAGDHMVNDVMGDGTAVEEASWKSQLDGFEIDGTEKGLGFNTKILDIYLEHLEAARHSLL
jgi:sirohydrochlorin cobaltochelatase